MSDQERPPHLLVPENLAACLERDQCLARITSMAAEAVVAFPDEPLLADFHATLASLEECLRVRPTAMKLARWRIAHLRLHRKDCLVTDAKKRVLASFTRMHLVPFLVRSCPLPLVLGLVHDLMHDLSKEAPADLTSRLRFLLRSWAPILTRAAEDLEAPAHCAEARHLCCLANHVLQICPRVFQEHGESLAKVLSLWVMEPPVRMVVLQTLYDGDLYTTRAFRERTVPYLLRAFFESEEWDADDTVMTHDEKLASMACLMYHAASSRHDALCVTEALYSWAWQRQMPVLACDLVLFVQQFFPAHISPTQQRTLARVAAQYENAHEGWKELRGRLTRQRRHDPEAGEVRVASDGYTYPKDAIEGILATSHRATSPTTGEALLRWMAPENHALRMATATTASGG